MNTDTNRVKEFEEDTKKIPLEGGWAQRLPDGSIRFYTQDGSPLFAINTPSIEYAAESLTIVLQAYINGFAQGRAKGIAETRHKITELIKLCL
jgi:hypothetical protein